MKKKYLFKMSKNVYFIKWKNNKIETFRGLKKKHAWERTYIIIELEELKKNDSKMICIRMIKIRWFKPDVLKCEDNYCVNINKNILKKKSLHGHGNQLE